MWRKVAKLLWAGGTHLALEIRSPSYCGLGLAGKVVVEAFGLWPQRSALRYLYVCWCCEVRFCWADLSGLSFVGGVCSVSIGKALTNKSCTVWEISIVYSFCRWKHAGVRCFPRIQMHDDLTRFCLPLAGPLQRAKHKRNFHCATSSKWILQFWSSVLQVHGPLGNSDVRTSKTWGSAEASCHLAPLRLLARLTVTRVMGGSWPPSTEVDWSDVRT